VALSQKEDSPGGGVEIARKGAKRKRGIKLVEGGIGEVRGFRKRLRNESLMQYALKKDNPDSHQ